MNIHLTGCHHSCAQHYIGDIGLIGARVAVSEEGDTVEGYHLHVGGGFGSKGTLGVETIAAIELARAAKAPVRVVFDSGQAAVVARGQRGLREAHHAAADRSVRAVDDAAADDLAAVDDDRAEVGRLPEAHRAVDELMKRRPAFALRLSLLPPHALTAIEHREPEHARLARLGPRPAGAGDLD